ncbi:MAG: hypothetical protein U0R17_04650 [Acidimicrobiia bacterium]
METQQIQQHMDEIVNQETFLARVCQDLGDQVQSTLNNSAYSSLIALLEKPDDIQTTNWNSQARRQAEGIASRLTMLDTIYTSTMRTRGTTLIDNCRAQQELYQR